MWKRNNFILIVGLLFVLLNTSCKTVEEISSDEKVSQKISKDSLLSIVSADSLNFKYFFSKVDIKLESEKRNGSFDAALRITKDSAMTANLSFFNIIIANALIRTDSAFVTNKRDDCYTAQSIEELANLINVDIGYEQLQRLLAGSVPFYDENIQWQQLKRDNFYVISSHSDKEVKNMLERTPAQEWSDTNRIFRYFITPKNKKIKAARIDIPQDTLTMITEYNEVQIIDGIKVPKESLITINKGGRMSSVLLKYKRTRLPETQKLHFVIPESYDACK